MSTISPTPAIIVAGGDPVSAVGLPPLPRPAVVIAADGGVHTARTLGLAVDLVVGDFDSAAPAEVEAAARAGARVERHPTDKDATDLELALDAALERALAPAIVLGGASFDRIDHFLANALLLAAPRYRPLAPEWWVKGARVVPVHDRVEIHGTPGQVVTLIPVGGPAAGITTRGLRWPLEEATLHPGSTRGVSNVLTAPTAIITVAGGVLLAVHTEEDR